eukprot:gb/GECG01015439.1/.p1 GENE.gb/GECG01015439.1/~~gb/GECG01015439.1/.p1  ORF type:complete len:948 (+),score=204.84 gb/GECG01015439.1/:1-2844(+)
MSSSDNRRTSMSSDHSGRQSLGGGFPHQGRGSFSGQHFGMGQYDMQGNGPPPPVSGAMYHSQHFMGGPPNAPPPHSGGFQGHPPPPSSGAMFASMPGTLHQQQFLSPHQHPAPFAGAIQMMLNPQINTGPWKFEQDDPPKYRNIFTKTDRDKDGYMTEEEAMNLLKKSSLEDRHHTHIWELADVDKDGFLDFIEFAILMHVAVGVSKRGKDMPDSLPQNLKELKPEYFMPQQSKQAPVQQPPHTQDGNGDMRRHSMTSNNSGVQQRSRTSSADKISDAFAGLPAHEDDNTGSAATSIPQDNVEHSALPVVERPPASVGQGLGAAATEKPSVPPRHVPAGESQEQLQDTLARENQRYRRDEHVTEEASKSLNRLNQEKAILERQIQQTRDHIEKQHHEFESIMHKISETVQQIHTLRETSERLQQQSNSSSYKVNEARGRLNQLVEELNRLRGERNSTEDQASAYSQNATEKHKKAAEVNNAATALDSIGNQHEAEAELLESEIQSLKRIVEAAGQDKEQADRKLTQWQSEADTAERELNNANERYSAARNRSVRARQRHEQALQEKQELAKAAQYSAPVGVSSSSPQNASDDSEESFGDGKVANYSKVQDDNRDTKLLNSERDDVFGHFDDIMDTGPVNNDSSQPGAGQREATFDDDFGDFDEDFDDAAFTGNTAPSSTGVDKITGAQAVSEKATAEVSNAAPEQQSNNVESGKDDDAFSFDDTSFQETDKTGGPAQETTTAQEEDAFSFGDDNVGGPAEKGKTETGVAVPKEDDAFSFDDDDFGPIDNNATQQENKQTKDSAADDDAFSFSGDELEGAKVENTSKPKQNTSVAEQDDDAFSFGDTGFDESEGEEQHFNGGSTAKEEGSKSNGKAEWNDFEAESFPAGAPQNKAASGDADGFDVEWDADFEDADQEKMQSSQKQTHTANDAAFADFDDDGNDPFADD